MIGTHNPYFNSQKKAKQKVILKYRDIVIYSLVDATKEMYKEYIISF